MIIIIQSILSELMFSNCQNVYSNHLLLVLFSTQISTKTEDFMDIQISILESIYEHL